MCGQVLGAALEPSGSVSLQFSTQAFAELKWNLWPDESSPLWEKPVLERATSIHALPGLLKGRQDHLHPWSGSPEKEPLAGGTGLPKQSL